MAEFPVGDETHFEGGYGRADRIVIPPELRNASEGIATWLLFAPHAHPMWSYHILYAIRLREVPGMPQLFLEFPEANHEIGVLALDPEGQPYSSAQIEDSMRTSGYSLPYLTPPDAVVQLDCTDDEARKLSAAAAWGVTCGHLIPDSDGASGWLPALLDTLEHLRTGGHHDPCNGRH